MTSRDRIRVLLVEGNLAEARRLVDAMTSWRVARVEVEHVDRLSQAMDRLTTRQRDVVLLDLSLPDSSGLETLERVKAQSPDLPILLLTTREEEPVALRAVQLGAQDYLIKTVDSVETVLRAMCCAIERTGEERRLAERMEHQRLLTDQMPCALWTTDLQLRFTSFTGASRVGWEDGIGGVNGLHVREFFAEADAGRAISDAHARARDGHSQNLDFSWKRRFCHVWIEPFRDRDGHTIGTIGTALDVTEQRRAEAERQLIRRIHAGLFPPASPQCSAFDIAGASVAVAEAGGDYYDYFTMQDGSTGIVVCDVAGHGLGPALAMSQTRAYLRALTLTHSDPGDIVSGVNRLLCSDVQEERLITLFFAKLDPKSHTLVYANAGHHGYLLKADHSGLPLEPTGIPLNVSAEAAVSSSPAVNLAAGDLLVLYTDGITENPGPDGQLFGVSRMLDLLSRIRQHTAREMIDNLFRNVRGTSGDRPVADDMTAVIVKSL
jgi:CheY-like chemotaxis protein